MFLCVVVPETGVVITSSVCPPVMSQGVGMFGLQRGAALPSQSRFTYQAGPRLHTTAGANEVYPQPVPWMVPNSCVPSVSIHDMPNKTAGPTERVSFMDSPSFPRHSMSSTFQGLLPNVTLQSSFPGSSVAVFEGESTVVTSVQSAFVGLPCSRDMPSTMMGPFLQLQPQAQHDNYLRDQEEFSLGKQQLFPSVLSAPNSLLTQQAVFRPPAHLVEVLPAAQPRALAPLPCNDPASLASIPLPLDQQPVRLLLPSPVMPPRPPSLLLTSGQPSNMPIAVASPLAVVQETPSVALQSMPVLPLPPQFRMENPPMSVHMHEMPRPGLMTEQSPIKLLTPFQSDPPVHGRPMLNVMLQEVPVRPPAVGQMPSLADAGEMPVGQQSAVLDAAPVMIRPLLMPKSPKPLLGIEHHQVRWPPQAPEFVQEQPKLQPVCEPQNESDVGLHDTLNEPSAELHSEYRESSMLRNQAREMLQQCDRRFSIPVKPLMAPGQVLEALQRMPIRPSRDLLQTDLSPMRATELRPPEFGRVPRMTLPVMEPNDLLTDEHLEQHDASSFSGSAFSSRLPAPAVVRASSQIIGSSRLPDDRFQSEFQNRDFENQQESDSSLLDHHGNESSVDRVGPLSHVASTSENSSSLQPSPDRTCVPSLLDEKLLKLSQSTFLGGIHRQAPMSMRRWNDWSGGGMLAVDDLKAAVRPPGDWNRRRTFHQFSGADEDSSLKSPSYEPSSKLVRTDEDVAAEPEDVPTDSTTKCDGNDDDDKVTVSAASVAITEPSSSGSAAELS